MGGSALKRVTVSVILAVSVMALYWCLARDVGKEEGDKYEFPRIIGVWAGQDVSYDRDLLDVLNADRITYREFTSEDGRRVTLFSAYYGSLEKADFSHSPIVCLTGQGWSIEGTGTKEIVVDSGEAGRIVVNEMVQTKTDTRMIALYWYQSGRGVERNRGVQKLKLFLERLVGRVDENAFVRVTAVVPQGGNLPQTRQDVYDFIRAVYPCLRQMFA